MKKKDSYLTSTIQYVFFYQTAQTEIVRYNYTVDLVKFLTYIQGDPKLCLPLQGRK